MSSEIEIANRACVLIGTEARIASLDDDRTVARKLKAVWNTARRSAIRESTANFAMRRASLAAKYMPDGAPYPWENAFPMPADNLRLIEVLNLKGPNSYQLEGGNILCNTVGPVHVRYLIDVPEPAEWDEGFAQVFACKLALEVGPAIAGSEYSVNKGDRDYALALRAMKRADAMENPGIEQAESDWVSARWGYGA